MIGVRELLEIMHNEKINRLEVQKINCKHAMLFLNKLEKETNSSINLESVKNIITDLEKKGENIVDIVVLLNGNTLELEIRKATKEELYLSYDSYSELFH